MSGVLVSTPVLSLPLHENAHTILAPTVPSSVLVQSASNTATVGTTVTVTLPNPTGTGNCLVTYVGAFQATTNPVVSGVTLGGLAGNYGLAVQDNVNADAEIWVDWNAASGQTSVVVTFTPGSGTNLSMAVLVEERSLIQTSSTPVDKTNHGSGISASPSSGSSGVLNQASEVVVGLIVAAATITGPGAPWVLAAQLNVGVIFMLAGAQVVAASTAQTFAGAIVSAGWDAAIVSLKSTAVVGGPVPGSGVARISPGQPGGPGSGVGATRDSGLLWNVTGIAVSVATNVKEATAQAYISYGIQSNTPDDFQGQTQTGSTGDTCTVNASLRPNDWITVIWSGGDPGQIATARIFGTITPPGGLYV